MPKSVDLTGLLEFIVKSLVDSPEEVAIKSKQQQGSLIFELKVSEKDRGRVIGKQGKTIKSIRKLLSAAASGSDRRVVLELVE